MFRVEFCVPHDMQSLPARPKFLVES